jgi:LDH2 family malate/lactate/ureidoglycolate dehydrogenase
MTNKPRGIPAPDLRTWVTQVLARSSVLPDEAALAADVLVSANLRGVDTHGVVRLPLNVRRVRSGAVNARPEVRVVQEGSAAALVDGDNGMGLVVGVWAMREAIRRAREQGTAAVSVRHSNHFGAAAYYAQMASAADMIGLSFTNTDPGMAPWGSTTPYLGTNPLAFAAPGGMEGGIVMDMATSQVSWGKVMLAARAGQKIPLGWATDREGRATEDALEAMRGLMLPLGGYKGYGLALMVEILSGVLSGSSFGPHVADDGAQPYRPQDVGHFFMAIDVESFMPVEQFKARMNQLVDEIHACHAAEEASRIYVPGEIEMETAARRQREGIPLPNDLVQELVQLGEQLGEPFPSTEASL